MKMFIDEMVKFIEDTHPEYESGLSMYEVIDLILYQDYKEEIKEIIKKHNIDISILEVRKLLRNNFEDLL